MRVMPALFIDNLFAAYPKIMGVQQRHLFIRLEYCLCPCASIIHSFRTDENYVMGRDSVVSCMLVRSVVTLYFLHVH